MKNEKGFTLMEMLVAIGVIGMIGTLLISSVVSVSSNTKTADIISLMDTLTTRARDTFELYPYEVVTGTVGGSSSELYPFTDMAYERKSDNEMNYRQSFNEKFNNVVIGSADEYYNFIIKLEGTDKGAPSGFSFTTKSYKMTAELYVKRNGTLEKEPIYTKTFVFDNIAMKDIPTVAGDGRIITFDANGGCLVNNTNSTACIGKTMKKEYTKGDSLYSPGVDGQAMPYGYKAEAMFIGYSLGSTDGNLLGNDYRVTENKTVYAQYLSTKPNNKRYRLEFHIDGSERFNVKGINGDAATKPYYIEQTFYSGNKTNVRYMRGNVEDFFVKDAVQKSGQTFKCWKDGKGNRVDLDTELTDQYTILYPDFVDSNVPKEEHIIQMTLDLTGVVAGENGQDSAYDRLYAIYPFTRMEYSLNYNKSTDVFTVVQKEIFNNPKNTSIPNYIGKKDGDVMSQKEFSTNASGNFSLKDTKGNKYTTFTQYMDAVRDKNKDFTISNFKLEVVAPTFDLGKYYADGKEKDDIISNGATMNKSEADSLFNNNALESVFTFGNESGNSPMNDKSSIEQLGSKIFQLNGGYGSSTNTFTNAGTVRYTNGGTVGSDTYKHTITIPGGTEEVVVASDERFREVEFTLVLPISQILIVQNNITAYDFKISVENNHIMIQSESSFIGAGSPWYSGAKVQKIDTGLEFESEQGNGFKQYTRITKLWVTQDYHPGNNHVMNRLQVKEQNVIEVHNYKVIYIPIGGGLPMWLDSWYPQEAFSGKSGDYESPFGYKIYDEIFRTVKVLQHPEKRKISAEQIDRNYGYGIGCNPFANSKLMKPACFQMQQLHEAKATYVTKNYTETVTKPPTTVEKVILTFTPKGDNKNHLPSFLKNKRLY